MKAKSVNGLLQKPEATSLNEKVQVIVGIAMMLLMMEKYIVRLSAEMTMS